MLKYIGTGFLPGVPARDLSDAEVEQHGGEETLIASGLYESSSRPILPKEQPPSSTGATRKDYLTPSQASSPEETSGE